MATPPSVAASAAAATTGRAKRSPPTETTKRSGTSAAYQAMPGWGWRGCRARRISFRRPKGSRHPEAASSAERPHNAACGDQAQAAANRVCRSVSTRAHVRARQYPHQLAALARR